MDKTAEGVLYTLDVFIRMGLWIWGWGISLYVDTRQIFFKCGSAGCPNHRWHRMQGGEWVYLRQNTYLTYMTSGWHNVCPSRTCARGIWFTSRRNALDIIDKYGIIGYHWKVQSFRPRRLPNREETKNKFKSEFDPAILTTCGLWFLFISKSCIEVHCKLNFPLATSCWRAIKHAR